MWKQSSYYGEFKNGQKQGIGRYIWKNKARYDGEWKNDTMNGYGIYYFSDGRKYLGEWKNNYMEGFGIYLWNNKKKYYGFFKRVTILKVCSEILKNVCACKELFTLRKLFIF